MRNLLLLAPFADHEWLKRLGLDLCEVGGAFKVASPIDGAPMSVLAVSGEGWDHVSVSRPKRCPNWPEMAHVKRLFFWDEETVMELHVPPEDHVNLHPTCLHLWRPLEGQIPRPPSWMVGGPREAP